MEPHFDTETDELLHLDIGPGAVVISPLEWATRGKIGYWLTSELFGLREDRSQEAEIAIQAAKDFMGGHLDQLPEGLRTAEEIHGALKQTLSGQDPFWPRWMMKTGLED
jgi:hypothetical protein